jgi:hypothetical protein
MKKTILLSLLLLLFTFPFWLLIIWQVKGKKEIKVAILDKTVLDNHDREHSSLNWILTNWKYCKKNRELYQSEKDYFGFFPLKDYKYYIKDFSKYDESTIDRLVRQSDLAYVTDSYGIYYQEWYKANPRGEHSPLIYGGLNSSDLALLKEMKKNKKLVITEYNSIASPTKSAIRNEFEDMYMVRWTGWVGRYFDDLDTLTNKEIPAWLVRDYKAQHKNRWDFTRAGIAFVHESGRVEIMEDKTHLTDKFPVIITQTDNQKRFGLPYKIKYGYWFDVMLTSRNNNVISVYKIYGNQKGDSILASMNIPNPFPAVIEHYDNDYKFYYFCGDFCDNPLINIFSRFYGITYLKKYLPLSLIFDEREGFFWRYYEPLVSRILDSYYKSIQKY